MADLSPAAVNVAVLLVAAILYAVIWYATRGLSRFAQMLARLAPLSLLIPGLLYMSTLSTRERMAMAPRPAPSVESTDMRRSAEMEAERRAAEESRRKAVEAERSAKPAVPPPEVGRGAPPAGPEPPTSPQPRPMAPEATTAWDVVPVFYGTDRVRKDEPKRAVYTSERARKLELGRALVTVPKTHQVPNIERPFAIRIPYINVTIYEQAEDPKQHFTVQELKALDREEFIALTRARIGGSDAFKDQAVVFVHGYNTEFDYALFRTAQMAYDLEFDGAALLYSWPSASGLTGYYYDRESSEQAEPYLRDFIELVVKDTGAKSVSVIAHSMGNMPLLRVLQALGPSLPPGVRLNQVILAAPDVDRNLFENLAANLRQYGNGITLYCSANDRAMEAARRVAGGIPRAGDVPSDGPLVIAGIDTIDITQASTDYLALNHSSYAEKSTLLKDIGLLLLTGERPPDRRIPDSAADRHAAGRILALCADALGRRWSTRNTAHFSGACSIRLTEACHSGSDKLSSQAQPPCPLSPSSLRARLPSRCWRLRRSGGLAVQRPARRWVIAQASDDEEDPDAAPARRRGVVTDEAERRWRPPSRRRCRARAPRAASIRSTPMTRRPVRAVAAANPATTPSSAKPAATGRAGWSSTSRKSSLPFRSTGPAATASGSRHGRSTEK